MEGVERPTVQPEGNILYPKDSEKNKNYRNDPVFRNLRGKTLEIYYFLVSERKEYGVREIQRYFNYSSPSIASYHLTRLLDTGLIKKSNSQTK